MSGRLSPAIPGTNPGQADPLGPVSVETVRASRFHGNGQKSFKVGAAGQLLTLSEQVFYNASN